MNSFSQFSAHLSTHPAPSTSHTTRQRLGQLWINPEPAKTTPAGSTTWYGRLGQWLLHSLTDGEQVRIWTKLTPSGIQWHAYDPKRQRKFSGTSEEALRSWLEQRYYS